MIHTELLPQNLGYVCGLINQRGGTLYSGGDINSNQNPFWNDMINKRAIHQPNPKNLLRNIVVIMLINA